ncbi:hypothetical protein Pan241w_53540 [Gimesia alba]|uniref:Rhamnogalacturonan lyase domain-containing protein n=1 Tax=Gimesia alba TaxID=2527973 RepID=A0A517RMX8_9PLAN|nr:hypothetical protein [Gimesia alba]QDT45235.1 hypothetical protein Pan241w_53540 [Gimesia alba]
MSVLQLQKVCFRLLIGFSLLSGLTACSQEPDIELPEGTKVSGTLANGDVLNVVYWPKDESQEPHVFPVRDDHVSFTYISAVPPGEYTVYAYISGARAKVADVTVGEEPVVLDIPESLEWQEARDKISGM